MELNEILIHAYLCGKLSRDKLEAQIGPISHNCARFDYRALIYAAIFGNYLTEALFCDILCFSDYVDDMALFKCAIMQHNSNVAKILLHRCVVDKKHRQLLLKYGNNADMDALLLDLMQRLGVFTESDIRVLLMNKCVRIDTLDPLIFDKYMSPNYSCSLKTIDDLLIDSYNPDLEANCLALLAIARSHFRRRHYNEPIRMRIFTYFSVGGKFRSLVEPICDIGRCDEAINWIFEESYYSAHRCEDYKERIKIALKYYIGRPPTGCDKCNVYVDKLITLKKISLIAYKLWRVYMRMRDDTSSRINASLRTNAAVMIQEIAWPNDFAPFVRYTTMTSPTKIDYHKAMYEYLAPIIDSPAFQSLPHIKWHDEDEEDEEDEEEEEEK